MKKLTTYLSLFILMLALGACGGDSATGPEPEPKPRPEISNDDLIAFFKELTIGVDKGNATDVTRHWKQEMRIYLGGEPSEVALSELDEAIIDLNRFVEGSNLAMSITEDSLSSNAYIFFGPGSVYAQLEPSAAPYIEDYISQYFIQENGATNDLVRTTGYINESKLSTGTQIRYISRRLAAQMLGFTKSPEMNVDCILGNGANQATEYVDIDKWLIQLLYHSKMSSGLTEAEVDPILRDIIDEVRSR